jgi:hypothetical protein
MVCSPANIATNTVPLPPSCGADVEILELRVPIAL